MARSLITSLIYERVSKWMANRAWPWIVKNIWPIVRKQLIALAKEISENLRDSIIEWINTYKKQREQAANDKEAEAEHMARNADNETEAVKYRAIAQVWRDVAEQFRQENELLKAKVNDAVNASVSEFHDKLNTMQIEQVIDENKGVKPRLKGPPEELVSPESANKL